MNKPNIEAVKEVGRWVLLFCVSWLITEVLKQITLVPLSYTIKVWVFSFTVPVQMTLQTVLTLIGRYIDKLLFERSKTELTKTKEDKPTGLLPF